MHDGWRILSLREAGVRLLDCEHRTPSAVDSGYPYLAIPQMRDGRIRLDGVRRISKVDFERWTRKTRPQTHDVILSRRCNPGETAPVPPELDCALGQNLVLLRSEGEIVLPSFLRWLVRGPEWWEQVRLRMNVGVLFESLKCADIPNFHLPVPPLSEQIAIARILNAIDDKIELNRQINTTLEKTARALFDCWLAQFSSCLATATVQELSESSTLIINDGYRAKRSELDTIGLPFVRAGNLHDDGVRLDGAEILSSARDAERG